MLSHDSTLLLFFSLLLSHLFFLRDHLFFSLISSSSNWTAGTIPSSWGGQGAFAQLLILDISSNVLSGTLPASWPPSLQSLSLEGNQLMGTLPAQLGLLTYLEELSLTYNLLTGQLPEEWSHPNAFPQLFDLELVHNNVTGPLPSNWGSQSAFQNLLLLTIDNNSITGSLPDSWASDGAFPQLQELGLSHNKLQGTMPASWTAPGAFAMLQTLSLGYTYLEGPLPSFRNDNLKLIDLEGCPLNSNLAAFWTSTAPLQLVTLTDTSLFGPLPDLPGALSNTRVLDSGGTQLSGTLPLSWLQAGDLLSHVSYLDVGQVWTRSIGTSNWRQQLCLQKNLYNIDTTGQQLSLLPELRRNLSSIAFIAHASDVMSAWASWLQSGSYISSITESDALSDVSQNQLTSVKEICANHNAHLVLLIVWLVSGVCCLTVLAIYACALLYTSRKGLLQLGPKSRLLPIQAAISSFYEAFAGLGGLAFYYYDLVNQYHCAKAIVGPLARQGNFFSILQQLALLPFTHFTD